MNFTAFHLRADLLSPIVMGAIPTHFDGLLWQALAWHLGSESEATAALPDYLQQTDGVYHASALKFVPSQAHSVVAAPICMIGAMRGSDLDPGLFSPYGRGGTYPPVNLLGGPTKARLDNYRGLWAPRIQFDAVGQGEAVLSLLQFYITGIGSHCQAGFGQVANWELRPSDSDQSLWHGGVPQRLLSLDLANRFRPGSGPDDVGSLSPPYWRAGAGLARVLPARVLLA